MDSQIAPVTSVGNQNGYEYFNSQKLAYSGVIESQQDALKGDVVQISQQARNLLLLNEQATDYSGKDLVSQLGPFGQVLKDYANTAGTVAQAQLTGESNAATANTTTKTTATNTALETNTISGQTVAAQQSPVSAPSMGETNAASQFNAPQSSLIQPAATAEDNNAINDIQRRIQQTREEEATNRANNERLEANRAEEEQNNPGMVSELGENNPAPTEEAPPTTTAAEESTTQQQLNAEYRAAENAYRFNANGYVGPQRTSISQILI